uniref:Uncharacterized protein n=1 Tax=Panagrolaimus sp. JU765 TaxID=591449 RepID=A0AC34R912_9BILA
MGDYNRYQYNDEDDSSEEEEPFDYPPPPPPYFYQNFTAINAERGMLPLPPPVPRRFTVFGERYDMMGPLVPPINQHKIPKLYGRYASMAHVRAQMKSLNASIMAC